MPGDQVGDPGAEHDPARRLGGQRQGGVRIGRDVLRVGAEQDVESDVLEDAGDARRPPSTGGKTAPISIRQPRAGGTGGHPDAVCSTRA